MLTLLLLTVIVRGSLLPVWNSLNYHTSFTDNYWVNPAKPEDKILQISTFKPQVNSRMFDRHNKYIIWEVWASCLTNSVSSALLRRHVCYWLCISATWSPEGAVVHFPRGKAPASVEPVAPILRDCSFTVEGTLKTEIPIMSQPPHY